MNCLRIFRLKIVLLAFLIFSYSITAETKKLLILGDSISAGYGIKESQNWVSLIQNEFTNGDKKIILINSSVSGDTSVGGVSRISKALDLHNPNFVLIELGGNDALRGYPIERIKNNLEKIIDLIINQNAKPILMQIKIPPNYGNKYIKAFENLYVEISTAQNIPLINFMLDNIALNKSLMQPDGIHPNQKAQPLIAAEMGITLKKIILK
ncbi:MAG: arylesterase [Gammaproteobacteria bacterium]|tara:strand:- start:659 stop:1288 length:630 start_codon:yes stop_codon:yes gene_type:complete